MGNAKPPANTPAEDAIRIAPLHVPEGVTLHTADARAAVAAAPPHLTYRGGPLLSAVEVFTLFWGGAWQAPTEAKLAQDLNAFFQSVLAGPLLTGQMAEYRVPNHPIGAGKLLGTATVATPALHAGVSDAAIRRFLQGQLQAPAAGRPAGLPPPGPNVLYFVYLPPGVRVTQGGSASCQAFCGYHDAFTHGGKEQVFCAAMPYPNCPGCLGGATPFDALTSTSSHELCEAITDPVPGSGWYDDVHGEIGDICAWKTKRLGGYTVQLEWSNQAKKCV